ncbi:site-specific DNA-methyltransferase [Geobacillus thermodenitrificans]|uniref:DNA-methyltransferase n=1 Tax=Geobacillus thermodenitrificans TaxID=33940 RepID=UPI003D1B4D77
MLEINKIYNEDCIKTMRRIDDSSIDLIIADPPYYKIKNEDWDKQWENKDSFLEWIEMLCQEWKRILKNNGSIYIFASHKLSSHVEVTVSKYFNILNNIRWRKKNGWHNKTKKNPHKLHSFLSDWESIIFAEQLNNQYFLREARIKANISSNEAGLLFPSKTGKPTGCVRNWELGLNRPDREQYEKLKTLYSLPNYDEAFRKFNVEEDFCFDIWDDINSIHSSVQRHPCEKPVELINRILNISSNKDDLVYIPFAGSGSEIVSCIKNQRNWIASEINEQYINEVIIPRIYNIK